MTKVTMNLQDGFLNQVRKDGTDVKVVLLDGTNMLGQVKGFDNFTVILHHDNVQSLIYKHAIAQLTSAKIPLRTEYKPTRSGSQRGGPGGHHAADDARERKHRVPATAGARSGSNAGAKKKEGFNTLDLSKVSADTEKSG